jgi:hypothetical protein
MQISFNPTQEIVKFQTATRKNSKETKPANMQLRLQTLLIILRSSFIFADPTFPLAKHSAKRRSRIKIWARANTESRARKTQKREQITHTTPLPFLLACVSVPARGGEKEREKISQIFCTFAAHTIWSRVLRTHTPIQTERGEWKAENKKRHPASQVFPRRQAIILDNTCSQPDAASNQQHSRTNNKNYCAALGTQLGAQNPPHHTVCVSQLITTCRSLVIFYFPSLFFICPPVAVSPLNIWRHHHHLRRAR